MKIEIEKLIYEGWGIGHDENGRAVFVKKSVPGDVLEVKITKEKKSYCEAVIEKIVTPSKFRIEAPCQYFDECGGCEHQNISYNNQLKFKEEVFKETLSRQGVTTDILPILKASDEFYYRNSIRFFLIEKPSGRKIFTRHNYLFEDGFVEAESCLLQSEKSNEILNTILKVLNQDRNPLLGFYQVKIREGKFTNKIMIELISDTDKLTAEKDLKDALREIPEIKSIYHTITYGKSLHNIKRRLIFGSPIIFEKIGKYSFQISPDSFFQTNSLGVKNLYDKIKEFAEIKFGENVLDLYCGTGTIGIYLSTIAKEVTGIEIVQSAINDAKANAKINKVSNADFICADATNWLSKHKKEHFDKIILDPPRAGLNKEIIKALSEADFASIIYVSCNPATFARDIKEFEIYGLELKKVQPMDMFPQTHHLECVGSIARSLSQMKDRPLA